MVTKEKNQELIKKFGGNPKDSGQPAAQIALMTERINGLLDHFARSPKDHMSRQGLLKMVGHRRRLLNYLRKTNPKRYLETLRELNLRK